MQRRHSHAAELLEGVGFESRAVALPIADARLRRGLRVDGAMGRDNAKPEAQKRIVDAVEGPLGGTRAGAERRLAAHQLHGCQGGERPRKAGSGSFETPGDFAGTVYAGADDVQQRP